MRICPPCGRPEPARRCGVCAGATVPLTPDTLAAFADGRTRERLAAWQAAGHLTAAQAATLAAELRPPITLPTRPEPAARLERAADALAAGVQRLRTWQPTWWDALKADLARPPATPDDNDDAHGDQLEDVADPAGVGGLSGLAALDRPRGPRRSRRERRRAHGQPVVEVAETSEDFRSLVGEYVWWFIGTLLILAGSVMGVREAWQTLTGVWRLVLIGGALLAYQGGFVLLARLVGRRSTAAGRVLGGIAAGLLPVAFVAFSWLYATDPGIGAAVAGLALLFAMGSLSRLAPLFEASWWALSAVLVPILLAELPLAATADPWVRALVPLLGVVSIAIAGRPWSADPRPPAVVPLSLALYGAAFLGIFALAGPIAVASNVEISFDPGGIPFAGLALGLLAGAAVGAGVAARSAVRQRFPLMGPVLEILALAGVVGAALGGLVGALAAPAGVDELLDGVSLLTVGGAALALGYAERRRAAALHLAVPAAAMAGVLLVRLWVPAAVWWPLGAAVVAALLLLAGDGVRTRSIRLRLTAWALLVGGLAVLVSASLDGGLPGQPRMPAALSAVVLGLAAHGAARRRTALHLVGAGGLAAALLLAVSTTGADPAGASALGLAALALAYGVVAFRKNSSEFKPFDDASLLLALSALALGLAAPPGPFGLLDGSLVQRGWAALPAGVPGLLLVLRAQRDRSRLVAVAGALGLAAAGFAAASPRSTIESAGVAAALALVWAVLATLRSPATAEGRPMLGLGSLPWGGSGRALLDGFAFVSAGLTVLAVVLVVSWLGVWTEPERTLAQGAALGAVAVALVAFLTPAFNGVRARGSAITLGLMGGFIVLTALARRVGLTRSPDQAALRYAIVGVGLWVLGRVLARFGPAWARKLGAPASGPWYGHLADVGALALAGLLVLKGLGVSTVLEATLLWSPPLGFLAAGVIIGLLAASHRFIWPWWPDVASLGLGLVLAWVQRGVLGPVLVQAPNTPLWLPPERLAVCVGQPLSALCILPSGLTFSALWGRVAEGCALLMVVAGVYIVASRRWLVLRPPVDPLRTLGVVALVVGAPLTFSAAALPPAVGLVVGGAAFWWARHRSQGELSLAAGGVLCVHALAMAPPVVPDWPGPLLAAAALGLTLMPRPGHLARQVLALVLGGFAVTYPLLSGQGMGFAALGWPLIVFNLALPCTLALLAAAWVAGATRWHGAMATLGLVLSLPLLVVADITALCLYTSSEDLASNLLFSLAILATLVHLAGRVVVRDDLAQGARIARDLLLVAVLGATLLVDGEPVALAGLGLAAAVALHAVLREHRPRHVYGLQLAAVVTYAALRDLWLPNRAPAVDAFLALGFAFVLVGLAVLARRRGIPPVAAAIRRFATVLPILAWVALPDGAGHEATLAAVTSAALYGLLAWAEQSRGFGSLAAIALNLALVAAALQESFDGVEVFLAPFGLLVLMLSHLFAASLGPSARQAVRIVGGLLIYAPAALKVTLQVGGADEGIYAVALGGVCLAAVALGMWLEIRAYLLLGTLFLTLDVVANLVHAGLRDHRIGFLVLTIAGLAILGTLVLATLKREAFGRLVQALRRRLRRWE